jgi:hypothetical protein
VDPDAAIVVIPAPVNVSVPPRDTEPDPELPAREIAEFVKSTLATLPLTIEPEFTEAVLIRPVVPETWNKAEAVAVPPTTRSLVFSNGATTPSAICQ